MFSDHNRIKLEINNREVSGTFTSTWTLSNLVNKEKTTWKIRKYSELNKMKTKISKFVGCYSIISIDAETALVKIQYPSLI